MLTRRGLLAGLVLLGGCGKENRNAGSAAAEPKTEVPPPPGTLPAPADLASPPADAVRSPSGLASRVLQPGSGTTHPQPQDLVEIQYTGWTRDGRMFDSTVPRKATAQFELASAMKGWAEGIGAMVVGERRRLWVPAALAYADGKSGVGPAGPLVFDIDLVRIIARPAPPAVPADLTAPPAEAQRLKSGVALRVLQPGTGTQHPGSGSVVEIHYSAWAADRRRFESTVTRGQPATVRLDAPGVIEGWKEAIPQMVVGEKARVWVPPRLGYGDKVKGGPLGPLVYDIELLAIR